MCRSEIPLYPGNLGDTLLQIDKTRVIGDRTVGANRKREGVIDLASGHHYEIMLEYFHTKGPATLQLFMQAPGFQMQILSPINNVPMDWTITIPPPPSATAPRVKLCKLALGGTASASTTYSTSYPPANAIDNNIGTYWCPSSDRGPSHWKMKLKEPRPIAFFMLDTRAYEPNLRNFQILASQDDKSYDVLFEQRSEKLDKDQPFGIVINDPKPYQYLKVEKEVHL